MRKKIGQKNEIFAHSENLKSAKIYFFDQFLDHCGPKILKSWLQIF
jgi:hypothetical protein